MMARYTGTDLADVYGLREGKRDIVQMLGGDDTVYLNAAALGSDDRIDAGDGANDTAIFVNGGFYNLGHGHFTGFERLSMTGSGAFELYLDDTVGQAGQTLVFDAINATGDKAGPVSLFVDGASERDASLTFYGSSGDDALIGGFQDDHFTAQAGNDLMTGNDGADTFFFEVVGTGHSWGKDRITDFHPGQDQLVFYTDAATGFDDLLIRKTSEGIVIRTPDGAGSVTLLGLLPRDLHASDVSFYPAHTMFDGDPPTIPHDHGLLL